MNAGSRAAAERVEPCRPGSAGPPSFAPSGCQSITVAWAGELRLLAGVVAPEVEDEVAVERIWAHSSTWQILPVWR